MSCEIHQFDVEFFQLKLLIAEQEKLIFHHCYIHGDVDSIYQGKQHLIFK